MGLMPDDNPRTTQEPPRGSSGVLPFRASSLPAATAFERELNLLFTRDYDQLLRYAAFFVGDDDAQDVLQNAFIEFWHKRPSDVGGKPVREYRALLFAAVRFRALDYRKAVRRSRSTLAVYLGDFSDRMRRWMQPDERENLTELARAIKDAVQTMSPRVREIYVMHHESGYGPSEIVALTGASRVSVKALINRGNRILRDHLDRAGFSPAARRSQQGDR